MAEVVDGAMMVPIYDKCEQVLASATSLIHLTCISHHYHVHKISSVTIRYAFPAYNLLVIIHYLLRTHPLHYIVICSFLLLLIAQNVCLVLI